MGKPYKYSIEYADGTLVLTTDPKGWQEQSIGFTRGDDFGLNVQNIVPLSFTKEGYDLLKSLYETTGVFTLTHVIIEKLNDKWTYDSFYKYRLDFKTYSDNGSSIEISGIEEGLLTSFQNYKDTEYEIDLPSTNKKLIEYTGCSILKKNLIQTLYGDLIPTSNGNYHSLLGSRSVRTYNNEIGFNLDSGEPFETMTIKALVSNVADFDIHVVLNTKITYMLLLSTPASYPIYLIRHNADFSGLVSGDILHTFNPTSTTSGFGQRIDKFIGIDETITVTGFSSDSKPYISMVYSKNTTGIFIDNPRVFEALDSYMEISNLSESPYQKNKLEVFTYSWLINQILLKINSNATLINNVSDVDFTPVLTATDCIKNLGKEDGTGKIKVKLSDVLKSYHCLKMIGIDITSNTMILYPLADLYKNTLTSEPYNISNIVVKHDTKHQFNKLTVGYNTNTDKSEDIVYPFNIKKTFEIKDTVVENEIDLLNPFKADPYDIENWIKETITSADTNDTCDIAILCISDLSQYDSNMFASGDIETLTASKSYRIATKAGYPNIPKYIVSETDSYNGDKFISATDCLYSVIINEEGFYNLELIFVMSGTDISNKVSINEIDLLPEGSIIIRHDIIYNANTIEYILIAKAYLTNGLNIKIDINCISTISDFKIDELYYFINGVSELYRNHTLSNFEGDAATTYNIPITPKRIFEKHLPYLSISLNGKTGGEYEYVNTDYVSNITSKCNYETSNVIENNNVSPVSPLFLPTTIEVDTDSEYNAGFSGNKYKYITLVDKKNNKQYQGWINSITFAPTKNKKQKLILQAKQI